MDPSTAPASQQEIKAYVRARLALADGQPRAAIELLGFAHRAGASAAARRVLADAYDAANRGERALAIRLQLVDEGNATVGDMLSLGRALAKRRNWTELARTLAVAIQSPEIDPVSLVEAVDGLATALEHTGRFSEAALARRLAMEALSEHVASMARPGEPMRATIVSMARRVADDFARSADFDSALSEWRALVDRSLADRSFLRSRVVFALIATGRPVQAQLELAEATLGGSDVALLAWAREEGVDLSLLVEVLAERVAAAPQDTLGLRLLAAADPERSVEALARAARQTADPRLHADLVAISFEAGPDAALHTAAQLASTAAIRASVVDALLAGPFDPETLYAATEALLAEAPTNAAFAAQVFLALERPDRAWEASLRRLEVAPADPFARREAIRSAGAMVDPARITWVARTPLDPLVEAARVLALAGAEEFDQAHAVAEAAVASFGEDSRVFEARARLRRAAATDPRGMVRDLITSVRLGNTAAGTWYEAVLGAAALGDPETTTLLTAARLGVGVAPEVDRLILAQEAIGDGRLSEAEEQLRRLADVPGLRQHVVESLLGLWMGAGRLDSGRRWLANRRAEQPSIRAWDFGSLHLSVAMGDAAEALDSLRRRTEVEHAGFSATLLAEALGAVERDERDAAIEIRRLERHPDGPAKDLALAAITVRAGSSFEGAEVRLRRLAGEVLTSHQRSQGLEVGSSLGGVARTEILELLARPFFEPGSTIHPVDAATLFAHLGAERLDALKNNARPGGAEAGSEWLIRAVALARRRHLPAAAAMLDFRLRRGESGEGIGRLVRPYLGYALASDVDPAQIRGTLAHLEGAGVDVAAAMQTEPMPGASWRLAGAGVAATLGFEEASIAFLEAAMEHEARRASILNNLGFALLDLDRDRARAAELIEAAAALDPAGTSELDSLGWLRYMQGEDDPEDDAGALGLISESIRLRRLRGERAPAEVLLHLGDAAWRAGHQRDAQAAWRSIVESKGVSGAAQQASELYAAWLRETFGAEIVEPKTIWQRLDGRWLDAARARLEALDTGNSPPVAATWAERDRRD